MVVDIIRDSFLSVDRLPSMRVLFRRLLSLGMMFWMLFCHIHIVEAQTVVDIGNGQTLSEADLVAGIFDGMPFALSQDTTFNVNAGGVVLPLGENSPPFDFHDSTVNVRDGGFFSVNNMLNVGPFRSFLTNATINLESGGTIGTRVELTSDSVLNVDGGTVGHDLAVNSGSTLNLFEGTLSGFEANSGSIVNIRGGSFGTLVTTESTVNVAAGNGGITAREGANVQISDGNLSYVGFNGSSATITGGNLTLLTAAAGSNVDVTGGNLNGRFSANSGSTVSLSGAEFSLNGVPYVHDTVTLSDSDVFSGTLVDGSPFIFSRLGGSFSTPDVAESVSLIGTSVPPIRTDPLVINTTSQSVPNGVREGERLIIQDTAEVKRNLAVVSGSVSVEGGSYAGDLEAVNADINVSGGNLVGNLRVLPGTTLNVSGGELDTRTILHANTIANVSGGQVTDFFTINPGSTVNITDGQVTGRFNTSAGSVVNIGGGVVGGSSLIFRGEVNVSDGVLGRNFRVADSASANISGGSFGENFVADQDSIANISGGNFGRNFDSRWSGTTTITGGEFLLNGVPFDNATITPGSGDTLTGTLSDGSTFIFAPFLSGDILREVNLVTTPIPPRKASVMLIDGSNDTRTEGVRSGESLVLREGGELRRNFATVNATVTIEGGIVGNGFEAVDSEIHISGGDIGNNFDIHGGSVVTLSLGAVGDELILFPNSTLNIHGGRIGDRALVASNSILNLDGGKIGTQFEASRDSFINISGGSIGANFDLAGTASISGGSVGRSITVSSSASVTLIGGEFQLNGVPYRETTLNFLDDSDIFTGTLSDGSTFIFSDLAGDRLPNVSLESVSLPTIETAPQVVDGTDEFSPVGLRAGQSLTLMSGGELPENFAVINGTLDVDGGTVKGGLEVYDSSVNILGGTIGDNFGVYGTSTVNIYGGEFGSRLLVDSESVVNLFVRELSLGGRPQDLTVGVPVDITPNGDYFLEATLSDGSSLIWRRSSFSPNDIFITGSRLTVTLVPEPSTYILLSIVGLHLLSKRRTMRNDGIEA